MSSRSRTLVLTTFQQVGLTLVRFGLPALVPFIRPSLGLSLVQVGTVLTSLDLGSFASFVPIGLAADRWGERRVLIAGGLLMGTLAAATALAPSYAFLLVGLALAGVGFPSGHTAGSKLIMRRFPPSVRGVAIGIRQSGLPAGGALAALIIPWLAGIGGWRLGLAAVGALTAGLGALCVLLPREDNPPAPPRSAVAPLRELAADRGFLTVTLMASMLVIGQFTLQGYFALYLVDQHRWTPPAAGRLLALVHLGGVAGRLIWGAASDRLAGARRTPVLGWVIGGGVAVMVGLGRLSPGVSAPAAAAIALAAGLFLAGWNGLAMNLLIERAGAARAATAVGASLSVMFLTTMASYPIFGWIVQSAGSYSPAWLLISLCQVAALITLTRVREA